MTGGSTAATTVRPFSLYSSSLLQDGADRHQRPPVSRRAREEGVRRPRHFLLRHSSSVPPSPAGLACTVGPTLGFVKETRTMIDLHRQEVAPVPRAGEPAGGFLACPAAHGSAAHPSSVSAPLLSLWMYILPRLPSLVTRRASQSLRTGLPSPLQLGARTVPQPCHGAALEGARLCNRTELTARETTLFHGDALTFVRLYRGRERCGADVKRRRSVQIRATPRAVVDNRNACFLGPPPRRASGHDWLSA